MYRISVASIVATIGALGPASTAGAQEQPTNVVFVLADDLGWTDLGCFSSDLYLTPNIDRLADQGMRFTSSYAACTVCSPTRASIHTGKYPARLRITNFIEPSNPYPFGPGLRVPDWIKALPAEEVTIAEELKTAGYICGHFGKWHLRAGGPEAHGFDQTLATLGPSIPKGGDGQTDHQRIRAITHAAVRFIEDNHERPFFCYVSHFTPHRPLRADPKIVGRYEALVENDDRHRNPVYAAMIDGLDWSVGQILTSLQSHGVADRTLVIFTSDNGGFLGDERDPDITTNTPLRGGKSMAYEGGIRVPTIIRWPGIVTPGSVSDEPIISNDFFPTIVQATGIDDPQTHDGISLTPLLRAPSSSLPRAALYWHYPHYHKSGGYPSSTIRAGSLKLTEYYDDGRVELFDLASDLGEERNLATKMPDKARQLQDQLHAWQKSVAAQMPLRVESN